MLVELRVENLGVIAELGLVLGPGMTVVTGETGVGKTLLVEALELLVGARADASLVRAGATEARVEGRFADPSAPEGDGRELVLTRVVVVEGRSRAYVNGQLAPVSVLAELGRQLVDFHGQHSHQSLLSPAVQRGALDRYAGAGAERALADYRRAGTQVRGLDRELDELGGDERARAREVDLLRFQVAEIDAASVTDPDEEARLEVEAAWLADATAIREGAARAHEVLAGSAVDGLGEAVEALVGREGLGALAERARSLQSEVDELARDARRAGEGVADDPGRLEEVEARRRLLRELRRKYGDDVAGVLRYRDDAARRLDSLERAEERVSELVRDRETATLATLDAAGRLSGARRRAAGRLAREVEAVLRELGLTRAEFDVAVEPREPGDDGADDVTFLLAANPGEPVRPLTRVASGGELARTMLAIRVVLTSAPPTLVFDEVDAGIGGRAGVAVGRKLAALAERHQTLCVTHLAQVAAFADTHVVVEKPEVDGRAVATACAVEGPDRVAELSRMLAGMRSERARDHAEELLSVARGARTR